MPRRARIMLAGLPVHIVQRGNNRQPCFYEKQDRDFYVLHLGRLLSPSSCVLHAYCLMTNHVHLLLTAKHSDSCARLMKQLGQLHTQYMNRTYGRSGTLWEGRFRSCIVQSEDYLLACYRYIESNPVRAGLAGHPRDYPWSSYRTNAEGVANGTLTPHEEYMRLGDDDDARRRAYAALFESNLSAQQVDEIRSATNGNFALGGNCFQQRLAAALGRRVERRNPGRPSQPSQQHQAQLELSVPVKKNVVCP